MFFPTFCGSGGSKSRLAKAAGAEPFGRIRDQKLHAVVAWSTFATQDGKSTSASECFWKLSCSKKCTRLWREARLEVNLLKAPHVRAMFKHDFSWHARRILHYCQERSKHDGFVSVSKISSRRGNRICKEAFRVAGAEQETSASEKLGSQGADFLRGGCILEHQMFTDDFAWQVQHFVWPSVTFSWQAQCCTDGAEKSQHAMVRGRQLCTQLSIFARKSKI